MQLTLYRLSVWATGASYGSKLQDLKYAMPAIDDGRAARALTPRVACIYHYYEISRAPPWPAQSI
jgi:peroxin-2